MPFIFLANSIYKPKAKKVQLVNKNNKIRKRLKG